MTLSDFDILGRVGDGSFSTVILARLRSNGQKYAIKVVNKHLIMRNKMVDYVKNERAILDKLTNDCIVGLMFTFQDADSLCKQPDEWVGSRGAQLTAYASPLGQCGRGCHRVCVLLCQHSVHALPHTPHA